MSYTPDDRAARRVADNASSADPVDGPYDLADDDVARATYPDPKARHLNRDSGILAAKRELADVRDGQRVQTADEPPTDDTVTTRSGTNRKTTKK